MVSRRRLVLYVALSATDVVLACWGRDRERLASKPLLMPALMADTDRPTQRALALSWLGDVALLGQGQAAFTTGLASFLAAHVAWIDALRRRPSRHLLRRRPMLAVPYAGALLGLNGYLWSRTGKDRLPVVAYSAVLTATALAALDTGQPATAAGGVLFMVSDSLLALNRFADLELPGHEGLVMATYTAAQALLART